MKRAVCFLWMILLLVSCSGTTDETTPRSLFNLGYGKSDYSLDLSGEQKNDIGMSLKKGIFYLLSRGEAKILRVSSYGQTLAMWYDPKAGSAPIVLKNIPIDSVATEKESGRFAMQVSFTDPCFIASDSRQQFYVVDNLYVRRFGSNGTELQPLGQEGIGGSAFPRITALNALENDVLSVQCVSESETLVYFYDKNGTFLYVLKLNDQTLPVPASILEKNPDSKGSRIVASLESLAPGYSAGKIIVILKINYYMEKFDSDAGVTLSIDPIGGWIIGVDAKNGTIQELYPLQSSINDVGIDQQLIAVQLNSALTIRWDDSGIGGEVYRYNQKGKVVGKLHFMVPDSEVALTAMTVGDDGYLYLLGRLSTTLRMYAWRLPGS